MLQARIRRPDHFAGIINEIGPYPGGLAEEAVQAGFVLTRVVAMVQHAEVAVPHRIVHEPAAPLRIRRAQEIFLLQAEAEPQRLHHGRSEPAHPQMPQRGHHGAPVRRRQYPEDVVVIHHLPHPQAAFQIVVEHVRHAVDGMETRARDGQRLAMMDGSMLGQILLQPGVQDRIVHLGRVEMDLHHHVIEEIRLTFLVKDIVDLTGWFQRLQDGLVRPFDPDVDVPAHAGFRMRIQVGKDGALQEAGVQAEALQDSLQFLHPLLMQAVDARDLVGQAGPILQDVQRRELFLGQTLDALIPDAYQRLVPGHLQHHFPITPGRGLPEGRFPAQGDQEKFSKRMHRLILPAVVPAEWMLRQRKPGQWMVIPHQAQRLRIADLRNDLDARTGLADAEALAREDLPITLRMELGETLAELELVPVDGQGTVRPLLPFHGIRRQAIRIDTQEVTHPRLLQAQIARHAVETHQVHDILLNGTENPLEHVIEMHADVRGNSAALVDIPLPGSVVPLAAGGNVRQIHVIHLVRRTLVHLLLQGDDGLVQAELEDVVGLVARLLLHLLEGVDVVGIQHHRLLTDDVAAQAQAIADECVVRIVRRADTHPLQRPAALHLLGTEAVEQLMLREERAIREETVQPSDTVELVVGGQQVVPCVLDGFQMPGRDVSRRPDQREVRHSLCFLHILLLRLLLLVMVVVMMVMLILLPEHKGVHDLLELGPVVLLLLVVAVTITVAIAIAVAVTITVTITVTIAIAVAITIAAIAVAPALMQFYAIHDHCHARELVVILQFLEIRQHPAVHQAGTEDEHAHVGKALQHVGIGNDTGRHSINNNELIPLAKLLHKVVQAFAGKQFGRVRRQRPRGDGIHSFRDNVVLDERVDIVGLSGQVRGETGSFPLMPVAREGTLAEVQVQQDDLAFHLRQAHGQVGGQEGLTGTLHQGQEQIGRGRRLRIPRELHIAPEDTERLGNLVAFLRIRHHQALVVLRLGGNLTQDRNIRVFLHILAVPHLGVEHQDQEEDDERDKHAQQNAQQDIPVDVRSYRQRIHPRLVDDARIALQGRLADQKLLALTQERQIQFLLDTLHPGQVVDIELAARYLPHLFIGPLAHSLHGLHLLAKGADVGGKQLVQVALEGALLQLHIPDNRVVRGTGFLILVKLQNQFVEVRNGLANVLILDVDSHREQPVLRIRVGELHQVLCMGDLRHQALHFLGGLDARVQVGLAIVLQIEYLVIPLESCNLGFLASKFRIQLRDTGIDVIGSLPDNLLLLVDSTFVIDSDHLIQDIRRPLGVGVLKGEIHNTIGRAIAIHLHLVPIILGHIHDALAIHHDRRIVVKVPEGPGRLYHHATVARGQGITKPSLHLFHIPNFNQQGGIWLYRHVH